MKHFTVNLQSKTVKYAVCGSETEQVILKFTNSQNPHYIFQMNLLFLLSFCHQFCTLGFYVTFHVVK